MIGVGIVGIAPRRSWGAIAHLPALRSMPERFRIAGIANSTAASAQYAATAVGERAFGSVDELIVSPDVDLVAVTVKVPQHAAIVRAALAAGKHVLCEWPLARTLDEAVELNALAERTRVVAAVGTQVVFAPAVIGLRALVHDGRLGKILSSTITGFGMTWGAEIEQRNAYLLDWANGATLLSIPVGHVLSAVGAVLGPIDAVQARLANRREQAIIRETGESVPMTVPDQALIAATTRAEAPLSIHYRGGPPSGPGLVWQVDGSARSARITSPSGLIEMAALTLEVGNDAGGWDVVVEPVAEPLWDGVARLYNAVADAIDGRARADLPTFADALALHRLLAAIERADAAGMRIALP